MTDTKNLIYLNHLREGYGVGRPSKEKVTDYERALLFLDLNECFVKQVEENGLGYAYYISSTTEINTTSISNSTDVQFTLIAGESLAVGSFVSIYELNGVSRLRKADASLGYRAHGFVKQAYSVGQTANVYQSGLLTLPYTVNIGTEYFLSSSGLVTSSPNTSWEFSQRLAVGVGTTSLFVEIEEPYNYT
jgi:hypothetical protein